MKQIVLFALFLLILPSAAQALNKGSVKVGQTISHDLAAKDQDNKDRSFKNLTGENGLVLVFIRSANWCPHCQKQLAELNKNRDAFKDAGYNLAVVSYDNVATQKKAHDKHKLGFPLLSDPGSDIIRAFGILNPAPAKGTFSYGIPHPGVYVINADKEVTALFFEDGYEKRPAVDDILAALGDAPEEQAETVPESLSPSLSEPVSETLAPVSAPVSVDAQPGETMMEPPADTVLSPSSAIENMAEDMKEEVDEAVDDAVTEASPAEEHLQELEQQIKEAMETVPPAPETAPAPEAVIETAPAPEAVTGTETMPAPEIAPQEDAVDDFFLLDEQGGQGQN